MDKNNKQIKGNITIGFQGERIKICSMFLESCHSLLGFSIYVNVMNMIAQCSVIFRKNFRQKKFKSRLCPEWYTGDPDPTY